MFTPGSMSRSDSAAARLSFGGWNARDFAVILERALSLPQSPLGMWYIFRQDSRILMTAPEIPEIS
jgi:hypothetical protein